MDKITQITQPYLFKNYTVLRDLPERDLEELMHHTESKQGKRGAVLFKQGFYPKGVFWLISGKAKIYKELENGQKQTIYIYSDGDIIAYRQLLAGEAHPVSSVLLENSVVRFIPEDIFKGMLSSSPVFARNILETLAKDFTVWTNRMLFFQKSNVRHKAILALLTLHEQYRLSGSAAGVITITRTELSDYVGASLETVVRELNKLKNSGLISIKGRKVFLHDLQKLLDILLD